MALKPQVLLYRLEACEVSALFLLTWRSARARPLRPVRWSCAAKAVQLGVVPEYIRLFTYAVDTCQRFPASLTVKVLRVAFRGRAAAFSDQLLLSPTIRSPLHRNETVSASLPWRCRILWVRRPSTL